MCEVETVSEHLSHAQIENPREASKHAEPGIYYQQEL